jgi:decaprenyl-phosphate phosphoribosyltransferase
MGLAPGLVRTARPRQWIKNLLVFAAPGAAGVLTHGTALGRSLIAFAIFCLAASGTYFMNDALDYEVDRLHPDKRHRPVAAGVVGRPTAAVAAALLLAGSIGLGAVFLGREFALALGVYAGINVAYSLWLKREPILDLAAVASGFLIRAIAGGLAVGVPLSNWFLIVASFGSLFMVAGKRQVDHRELELGGIGHRGALGAYSQQFLRFIRGVSAGIAITAYCFWAFEKASLAPRDHVYFELTIVPFVLAILRYALLLEGGAGGAPEDVVLRDRTILLLGAVWAALFAAGVYGP